MEHKIYGYNEVKALTELYDMMLLPKVKKCFEKCPYYDPYGLQSMFTTLKDEVPRYIINLWIRLTDDNENEMSLWMERFSDELIEFKLSSRVEEFHDKLTSYKSKTLYISGVMEVK